MIGIMSGSLDACAVYYPKQLQKTAYHEAGHAVIGYDLKLYNIQLASIIPDQKSLGRVQCGNYTRKLSKDDLKGLIRMNLAGYVAEQEFNFVQNGLIENFDEGFNILFVQAKKSSDLNEAIDIAQKLVKYFYNIDPEINKQEFGMKLEQILRKCYQQTVEEVNDVILSPLRRDCWKKILYQDEKLQLLLCKIDRIIVMILFNKLSLHIKL